MSFEHIAMCRVVSRDHWLGGGAVDLPNWGLLAMPRDSNCHHRGRGEHRGMILAFGWMDVRGSGEAAKPPTGHRATLLTTKNYPAQNIERLPRLINY